MLITLLPPISFIAQQKYFEADMTKHIVYLISDFLSEKKATREEREGLTVVIKVNIYHPK